jgi:L-amino acid N-acyltransferase
MLIRLAFYKDLDRITEIYNDAVLNSVSTFDINPRTAVEQEIWFEQHTGRYNLFVAEVENYVVGWASLSKWNDRPAYKDTTENSVFVDKSFRNKGIGKRLLLELILNAKSSGFHTIIARIATTNSESIRLHFSAGFESVGIMKEVGFKFGNFIDIQLYQLLLNKVSG